MLKTTNPFARAAQASLEKEEIERVEAEVEEQATGLFYFILAKDYEPRVQPLWKQNSIVHHESCGDYLMEKWGRSPESYHKIPLMPWEPRVKYNRHCRYCEEA
jgi:hypothetical protein